MLNAILWARARATRSVLICTGCSDAKLVRSRVSHTLMPTRQRELSGEMTLWYVFSMKDDEELEVDNRFSSNTSKTPKNTFQEQRWLSAD